ncbi:MAG: hypothetical protein NTU44_04070 [Bacteroidetes bacterium]|nr:hypothetical protein [Bacteroidota bacterium]
MNVGFYFPDNHPANFYSGAPTNENKLNLIFNNYYYKQENKQKLGYYIDSLHPYDLPRKKKYNPAYNIGFYVRYALSANLGVFAQFNFTKLTASDIFLMYLDLPQGYSLDARYRQYHIWGTEKRVNIDVGISRYYPMSEKSVFFMESGLNINNTRVVENKVNIEGTDYSLVNQYGNQSYIPSAGQQQYTNIQGGVGFGVFATGGVRLIFSENISLDPGMTFYWQGINLGTYDGFRPCFNIFVRFTFKNLI